MDSWIDDADTVTRVRDLLGEDKNVYVEPTIWTIEWARDFYDYPVTRSN